MGKTLDVAVLVGSLRKDSINRKMANALAELAPEALKLSIVEIGQLPIYNQDTDENPPAEWKAFRQRIRGCWDSSRVDDGGCDVDHGGKGAVCFVCPHGDALVFFEPAEEVLDEMAPFIHLPIEGQRFGAAWMLSDDRLDGASVEIGDEPIAVEGHIGDQRIEGQSFDELGNANRVEAISWQKREAHEIADSIREGENFGRHAALGAADGLARSPPFTPCP
jgi:hypothetical protein